MLNLFYRLWLNFKRPLIAAMIGVFIALPAYAETCDTNPVFAFTKALYLSQYERAASLLPAIKKERNQDLASFFKYLLAWKTAYDHEDKDAMDSAVELIDKQIDGFDSLLNERPDNQTKTTLGNIMFHAARMNFASGRIIRAANLSKRANEWLQEVHREEPNNADTFLALGLYQYYTGNDNDDFAWTRILLSLRGDKALGRTLIERALKKSPDYAFEAARSLAMDLSWQHPKTCLYPALSDSDANQTFAVAKQEIALSLFCGRAENAQKYLDQINNASLNQGQNNWLYEARSYTLAALGQVSQIQAHLDKARKNNENEQYLIAQFALAKLLDANGERDQALKLYDEINNSDIRQEYKNLIKAYKVRQYNRFGFSGLSNTQEAFECESSE